MEEVQKTYDAFATQGKGSAPGKKIAMDNKAWAKCCKDCKVQDNKKVTGADVDIVFSKVKTKGQNTITFDQFCQALRDLGAKKDKANPDIFLHQVAGKGPGLSGTTKTSKTGGVEKMTDASQYTGSHKERFDASGKGKGAEGRKDMADNSGYVGNYKGSGTYDAKVGK